jgi:hypothetical protein
VGRFVSCPLGKLGAILSVLYEMLRLLHGVLLLGRHEIEAALQRRVVEPGWSRWETAMVILGVLLIIGGSAIVAASAILWAWSSYRQKLLRGPDEGSSHPPEIPAL